VAAIPDQDPRRLPAAGRIALVLAIGCAFVLGTDLIDGGAGILPAALWQHPPGMTWWNTPLLMVCNALPGLLLAFLLLALTRRAVLSFLLAFGTEALVYGVNVLKVRNLGTPLMPADFRMVGQLDDGGGDLLSGYLPHTPWPYLAIAACIAVVVLLARYEPPLLARRPRRWRGVAAVALAAALGTLLAGQTWWDAVYNKQRLAMQPWSATATRQHTGLISSLMLFHLQFGAANQRPDLKAALRLMARYQPAVDARMQSVVPGAASSKPDIVVILSESFFNPNILNGYGPGVDFTPDLHRLAMHGVSGQLHVPTFGGGTIRTEFEVLTGLPLRYFPDVQFPYLQIHQKRIPGIVRDLERNGYTTVAVHGNDPGFWNRTQAFKELGFDKFVSIDDFPPDDRTMDGKYMSDKSFTDEVLRQLPDNGPPRFLLGISIEAHGPYDSSYGIDARARDAIPVPAGLTDPQAKLELRNYIYHMQHADRQLGRLVDTLAHRNRRTLIVFFGDHLPALMPAYQQVGFKNGRGFLLQTVPYVLIDTAHMDHAVARNAAAWELPGMLMRDAGIPDSYFALTQLLAPQLAVLTRAPDAPPPSETVQQREIDDGLRNVARLQLRNKLDRLWPRAAAMAQEQPPPVPRAPPLTTRGGETH
jgi:phosphoglycerol transferase MdoB-like AlkP superfamily enzyme